MKKIVFIGSILFFVASIYSQTFQIKQITSGDFDAKNPFISLQAFSNYPFIYFEKHTGSSSNIGLIEYNLILNTFQEMTELTTGSALRINPYEDFNHGIVFQTNENGNWDVAYRPYENGNWGPITFLANSISEEYNLSPFYANEPYFPMNNYILFQRSDTVIVLEYAESLITEYPVFVNTPQYQYSDYIGVYYNNFSGNYPRMGIHVIAVETDSSGKKNLISKYKPLNGVWDIKNIIKEDCNCSHPIFQFYEFMPYLIFEDSTESGIRPFIVSDWEYLKDIDTIPYLPDGDITNFRIDRPDMITSKFSGSDQLEYYPHSYFLKNEDGFMLRVNRQELGSFVEDTLINIKYNSSKMALDALGIYDEEIFYTIWEDSSDGHIHLFGRRQLYPVGAVSDEKGIDGFMLEQNYPNPFNPTTSIQYAIGSRQFVTLKVFDVLGNEIATLVNEEKPAGEYEVEFDARGLASGIYFYQLRAGGSDINSEKTMIQTKKMILIK
jgi:hypothetical protein